MNHFTVRHRQRLEKALVDAYPSAADFQRLVHNELGVIHLDTIVPPSGSTTVKIAEYLVRWAMAKEGGIHRLVAAAVRANPNHSNLKAIAHEWATIDFQVIPLNNSESIRPNPPAAIAPRPDEHFVGHAELITKMSVKFTSDKDGKIIALHGMGGVGKTAFVLTLAREMEHHFTGGIFWSSFAEDRSLEDILRDWARNCGSDLQSEINANNLVSSVRSLINRQIIQYGPVFALIDHLRVDRMTDAHLMRKALPASVPILVTTRDRDLADAFDAEIVPLGVLDREDAEKLLFAHARNPIFLSSPDLSSPDLISRLLSILGYLPLAVRLAGKRIARHAGRPGGFDLADYVEQVATRADGALDLKAQERGLFSTFAVTYDSLPEQKKRLFRLCSIWSAALLDVEHMASLASRDSDFTKESLDDLVLSALLDWDFTVVGRYIIHPLLKQYAYDRLHAEEEDVRVVHRQAAVYLKNKLDDARLQVMPIEVLDMVDHLEAAEDWDLYFVSASSLVGNLDRLGYWAEIDARLIRALKHLSESGASEDLRATLFNDRAIIASAAARWPDAIRLWEQALAGYEKAANVGAMAQTYTNLGMALSAVGEFVPAIHYYKGAIELGSRNKEPGVIARTITNLGNVFLRDSQIDTAIAIYLQILPILENIDDTIGVAQTKANLGNAYLLKEDFANAVIQFDEALKLFQQGQRMHEAAQVLVGLSSVHQQLKDFDRSAKYGIDSLRIFESLNDTYGICVAQFNLGNTYIRQGKLQLAIANYENALRVAKQTENIEYVAKASYGLGIALENQSETERAIQAFKESADSYERLGNNDTAIQVYSRLSTILEARDDPAQAAQIYDRRGTIFEKLRRWTDAVADYNRLLVAYERVGNIRGMARVAFELGYVHFALTNLSQSLDYYGQAQRLSTQVGDQLTLCRTYFNIGSLYLSQRDLERAQESFEQARSISEQFDDETLKAQISTNLATALRERGDRIRAVELFRQSVRTLASAGDMLSLAVTYSNLGDTYAEMQEWNNASGIYTSALRASQQLGNPQFTALILGKLGRAYHFADDRHKAAHYTARAYLAFSKLGMDQMQQAGQHLIKVLGSADAANAYLNDLVELQSQGIEGTPDRSDPI